jgi:hypothetical protein
MVHRWPPTGSPAPTVPATAEPGVRSSPSISGVKPLARRPEATVRKRKSLAIVVRCRRSTKTSVCPPKRRPLPIALRCRGAIKARAKSPVSAIVHRRFDDDSVGKIGRSSWLHMRRSRVTNERWCRPRKQCHQTWNRPVGHIWIEAYRFIDPI